MSGDLIIPASAETVLATLIREQMPAHLDVWVGTEAPNPRRSGVRGRKVRVSRTPGGGMAAHGRTDHVFALIECWADTEDEADDLAAVVRAIMKASRSRTVLGTFVRWWKENSGPYRWPDESDQERYQFTGELLLKIG
ncbi:hypothetical protein R4P64_07725 [Rhodococcus sp. IEGM 1366]|uniref:hypothetical protein n=1 Tax=Rhodococcus sp. IEGM 1366 TaxID=3082223 RepID=UPI0029530977|nr:hypothetical protein [Rhodococcus sp. IEGM 1366]MDV8066390.1 hypothetical protein [Rhodococcus sp. IEGM 1366]